MNKLATAIAAIVLIGTPAFAADMAVPATAYYPRLPPAIYDWTGIYLGGHIGGGMLVDSVSQNGVSPGAFNLAGSGNLRPAGVIGGAQIGANYEFVPWVVGIEASWTDSAIQGNTLIACSACPVPVAQERFTSQAEWFAALTGRVGYAANDWLFYAKAGGAWMNVRYTEDLLGGGPPTTVATQVLTDNRTGFTLVPASSSAWSKTFQVRLNTTSMILAARTTISTRLLRSASAPIFIRSSLASITSSIGRVGPSHSGSGHSIGYNGKFCISDPPGRRRPIFHAS